MTEDEAITEMLKLAEHLRDKLNRPDCKTAYDIVNREIMSIRLRVNR